MATEENIARGADELTRVASSSLLQCIVPPPSAVSSHGSSNATRPHQPAVHYLKHTKVLSTSVHTKVLGSSNSWCKVLPSVELVTCCDPNQLLYLTISIGGRTLHPTSTVNGVH